jgi:trigger factor
MTYSVKSLNGCTKKFIFNFEQVDLSKQIQEALVSKQKTSNLKGFRKGKAPLEMVKKLFGPQVENDALYRFVSEQFYEAVKKENIRAVGYPSFANTKYESGSKVAFEATVEIFPDFELNDYKNFSFKKESDQLNPEDMTKLIEQYLASKSEIVEVKDEAKKIDKKSFAVFNFEGTKKDGSKPDNMKASEYMLEIGSGQFIPGFEDSMIGMKKGDAKSFEITFPTDYHDHELQNEKVTFKVDILEIKEKKFPEFTDELAKEMGFDSVEDFNQKNLLKLEKNKKREVQNKLQQQILEKLISDNKFDIPGALLEEQKNHVKQDLSRTLKQQGFNDEMVNLYFEKWDGDIVAKADFQVRSGLILDKLSKKYNIETTEQDIEKKFDEMSSLSGMKKEELSSFYKQNQNMLKNLTYAIREEKTFEKLIADIKVT